MCEHACFDIDGLSSLPFVHCHKRALTVITIKTCLNIYLSLLSHPLSLLALLVLLFCFSIDGLYIPLGVPSPGMLTHASPAAAQRGTDQKLH